MQTQTPAYPWPTIPPRPAHRPAAGWIAILVVLLAVAGCASAPRQTESMDYRARAETRVEGAVRVSAVALSPAESAASFGVPLAKEEHPARLARDRERGGHGSLPVAAQRRP